MTPRLRRFGGIVLLAVLAGGQWALLAHLHSASTGLYPDLKQRVDELTDQLVHEATDADGFVLSKVNWVSPRSIVNYDAEIARQLKNLDFTPDSFVLRLYQSKELGMQVHVNLVYSREGFDRRHHPEICVRDVMGLPEESSGRRVLRLAAVEGQGKPVQRFGFRAAAPLTVYYWHYTLRPDDKPELSSLQFYHELLRKAPPSLSVQVWLQSPGADVNQRIQNEHWVESSFLPALDKELRKSHLPARVEMNCDRVLMGLDR